ncbi:MAG: c-type cytochrome [Nitrosomonadales bacterium]|nr:c-type cytochrome [Nitrosomonadales bacterium]
MHKTKLALALTAALCASCGPGNSGDKDPAIPGTEGYDPAKIELARKSNCFSCHAMGKKMIGPSLKDIAARYRGDAGAEERLIHKVARGSSGAWGSIPMPANSPPVPEADIRALVKFTLELK